ncbi:MAG: TonB-dependent receptor [Acidobacteria bacterium]|nr:TonB-dependent receptor [Acidobacteriota bacterium]
MTILLTPTKLNKFRLNWSRQTFDFSSQMDTFHGAVPPPASAMYPAAYSTSDQFFFVCPSYGAIQSGNSFPNVQRQFNLADAFSTAAGTHQIKFGGDFRHLRATTGQSNSFTVFADSYSNLQGGIADTLIQSAGTSISTRTNNYSLFGQDIWKASGHLTLTYGLRWDISTPPVSTTPGKPLYAVTGIFDTDPVALAPTLCGTHG